ncbi:xanthine dehydrogenase accessory factor [Sphingomonas laterariae]|uniref:Xanthine dehydrogenase accessory factor n=1 Tax=Edaphosphingomonas laterariae TaxID=861865 RepID=A0A239H0T7_9SPHN|nr:XdhC family protein [Sphingomonas laterariae]SNS74413.1 xanthine dehydrogenase accessory factor [Sphingomonas laterariae]
MAGTGDDLDMLLATAQGWLDAGHRVALATVIDTWGSAPRRKGAHAIIRDDGHFAGSVSGGCVEGDVIATAQQVIERGEARRLDYGVADETAWAVGLACGGRISILVQPIDEAYFPPALLADIRRARAAGASLEVATDLASGRSMVGAGDDGAFAAIYAPPLRMMIVGAVHIARALVPMARMIGYAPMIVDPRGSFATSFDGQDVVVDERWPDEALAEWRPDASTAIVTLTHDPKLDDPALAAALRSPAFYIAALGSRRTHGARLERLRAQGFGTDDLARIAGPAGLAIGAANPPEIALSILAQATERLRARP